MKWKQYLSVGVAILTCPCHLPLLAAALAGTVLGGWLSQYTLVVTLGTAGIFMLAVLYSLQSFTPLNDNAQTISFPFFCTLAGLKMCHGRHTKRQLTPQKLSIDTPLLH